MEIHPPHGSVHSVKDFLIHLFMIVLGILIALGIEQVREHFHERHVAEAARKNFQAEIDSEKQAIDEHLKKMAATRSAMEQFLQAEAAGQKATPDTKAVSIHWQFLPTSGWDTAAATQAFQFMEAAEVQRYSRSYTAQRIFNDFEDKAHAIGIELSNYVDRADLSADEKKARDRDFRMAIGYAGSIEQIGRELLRHFEEIERGAH